MFKIIFSEENENDEEIDIDQENVSNRRCCRMERLGKIQIIVKITVSVIGLLGIFLPIYLVPQRNPSSSNDVDECADGSHTCSDNENCINTVGSFICSCKNGYGGASCLDIDECALGLHDCVDINQNCTNTIGSYTCPCSTDYGFPTYDFEAYAICVCLF